MRVGLCHGSRGVKLNLLTLKSFKGLVKVESRLFQEDPEGIITLKPEILLALNPLIPSRNTFAFCFLRVGNSFHRKQNQTKTKIKYELEKGKFVRV